MGERGRKRDISSTLVTVIDSIKVVLARQRSVEHITVDNVGSKKKNKEKHNNGKDENNFMSRDERGWRIPSVPCCMLHPMRV